MNEISVQSDFARRQSTHNEIIVIGAGKMGVAVAYALDKLGFHIHLVEPNPSALKKAVTFLLSMKVHIASAGWSLDDLINNNKAIQRDPNSNLENIKTVISAAPYFANFDYAKQCVENGWCYCDLGGSPDSAEKINNLFKEHNLGCITDLGLAPGLANIIAEYGVTQCQNPESVFIRVGGLPENPDNEFKYNEVFSIEGLWNEYTGECEVLIDGNVTKVKALESCSIETFKNQPLEAFHTRGGLSYTLQSMQNKGIKYCDYKTYRFPGHYDLIKPLIESGKEKFVEAIQNSCPPTNKDVVFIDVQIHDELGIWRKEAVIRHDDTWTAMQKATAFPASAVASMLHHNQLPWDRPSTYADIPIDVLRANLIAIDGINAEELF